MKIKINNTQLTELTESCFDLSMDGRLSQEERREFLALGKRFRGCLLNLLTAQFTEGTLAVTEANTEITKLNSKLKVSVKKLDNIAQAISQLGDLVSILDDLLKIADATFI